MVIISWTKYHTNILKRVKTSNRQTVLIMGMSQGSFDTKVAKVVHKEIYEAITPKYNPAVVNYESYLSLMLNELVAYCENNRCKKVLHLTKRVSMTSHDKV